MLGELDDIYREVLLEHYRRPRHWGHLDAPTGRAEGAGEECGDQMTVEVRLERGRIADLAFSGRVCAVAMASSSLMSERVTGLSVEEAAKTIAAVKEMMQTGTAPEGAELGAAAMLGAIRKFPARVECVLLGWETFARALEASAPGRSGR